MSCAYPIAPFVPGPAGYQQLAELLERVAPESPASAAFMARVDAERGAGWAVRRLIAWAPDVPGRWVGVAEWCARLHAGDDAQFHLRVAVDPDHRRRGLGGELFRRALASLPGETTLVETEAGEDQADALRFLSRRGFRQRLRIQVSELELERFDPAAHADARSAVRGAGLVIRDLGQGGREDEALLRGLHVLEDVQLRDAPGAADRVAEPFERWRLKYQGNPDFRPELHLAALDREQVIGMTQLWASQATDAVLFTGFTCVARSHRRRGIATALKLEVLERARVLRTAAGGRPIVRTVNADSNPMLDINLRLGFEPRPARLILEAPASSLHRPRTGA